MPSPLDSVDLRRRVQDCLDAELATPGRACSPSWAPTSTTSSPPSPTSCAAGSGCGRPSSTGATGPPAAPTPTRWCASPAPWSCSRPRPSSTTTSWTTPTPAAGCRPPTVRSPPATPSGAGRATGTGSGSRARCWRATSASPGPTRSTRRAGCPRPTSPRGRHGLRPDAHPAHGRASSSTSSSRCGRWDGLPDDERVERAGRVIRYKSAKYTVEHPLLIGATTGGLDDAGLDALSRYGLDLGRAFQLRDDLLGVFGDPERDGQARRRRPARGQAHRAARPRTRGTGAGGRAAGREPARPCPTSTAGQVDELRGIIEGSGAVAGSRTRSPGWPARPRAALGDAPRRSTPRRARRLLELVGIATAALLLRRVTPC